MSETGLGNTREGKTETRVTTLNETATLQSFVLRSSPNFSRPQRRTGERTNPHKRKSEEGTVLLYCTDPIA